MVSSLFFIITTILTTNLLAVEEQSNVIYTNGEIWIGVPGQPLASTLVIRGERIVAVGGEELVKEYDSTSTRVIDLEGAFIVPGFIDNHTHFMSGGFQLADVNLSLADNQQQFASAIHSFAEKQPSGRWITGGRWDHERWGGELPRKEWINKAAGQHPVFVSRLDGHMGLANSLALDLAGITATTPDPKGGTIVRDILNGEPTGILKDEAMNLMFSIIPEPTEEERDQAFERAINHVLSLGITQVQDMCTWEDYQTYIRAAERNKLKIRIHAFVYYTQWEEMLKHIQNYGRGNDWLSILGAKVMVDGSLGSSTAWFYEPYLDEPSTSGLMVTDTAIVKRLMYDVEESGLQLAVHAIGDRANDWVLDAFTDLERKYGKRDRRFRIEHAQHLTSSAIGRFATLGVIPSMQPPHLIDDGRWAEKRIGPEVLAGTYAFRSLLDAGARLTFGSDWTVAPIAPLNGIYAAVTRRTLDNKHPDGWLPEQKISIQEALQCYTVNNAWGVFSEDGLGTLEAGKYADFVVLSENLLEIDPIFLQEVKILRTVVGGREQYTFSE
ncbi:MAG: amidohydrolase [Fidelibacterota bacterium]